MNWLFQSRACPRVRVWRTARAFAWLWSVLLLPPVTLADSWGTPGEPITLVVGYQPYFTESWSAVVVRALKLDEKYLPRGSHVEYQVGLSGGGVLLKSLQAGQLQLAYLGLMPTVTGAINRAAADLRVVAVAGRSNSLCNQVLIRADYPLPANAAAAYRWMDGKRLAVPPGTCAELFTQRLLSAQRIRPAKVYDQNFDLLATSFRTNAIDAATVWEPGATALVEAGLAHRLLSGRDLGESSASFIEVRQDFLLHRPDIVQAWLRAEREAQQFMSNPANADAVIAMVQSQTSNYSSAVLRRALYGDQAVPGPAVPRLDFPFEFTPEIRALLTRSARFLFDSQKVSLPALPADALQPASAARVADQSSSANAGRDR